MSLEDMLYSLIGGDVISKGVLIYLILQNEKQKDEIRLLTKEMGQLRDVAQTKLKCPYEHQ